MCVRVEEKLHGWFRLRHLRVRLLELCVFLSVLRVEICCIAVKILSNAEAGEEDAEFAEDIFLPE